MAIDIARIQTALQEDGLDGWLLYDFHGSNPIARSVCQLNESSKLTTRRWFYLIPSAGEPRGLVHHIEPHSLSHLPGTRTTYADRQRLVDGLRTTIGDCHTVAMEYSANGEIPYISLVDAGTIEAIRGLGLNVVSSGDLVQRFEAVWDEAALSTHVSASEALYRIKDRTFTLIAERLRTRTPTSEFEVQQQMMEWFESEGLITDCPPVVAAGANGGDPHYLPTVDRCRQIEPGDPVLIDLWGKQSTTGSVFADITWVAYAGADVPDEYARAFSVICTARDAAISLVTNAVDTHRELRGWEVDRAARAEVDQAGLGAYFVHRTGHSLGSAVHGNGVHMDDYETHDTRRLLPGTGFTIEPGVYFDTFGVRTEINMFVGREGARVTGPVQTEITPLL